MEKLTNQERTNMCFIFLSAYENLSDLIYIFHETYNQMYRGKAGTVSAKQIQNILHKKPDNETNKNQTLSRQDIQKLLIELDFCNKDDLVKFNNLAKKRNKIAHEGFSIYADENIDMEFFEMDEFLPLYIRIFKKMAEEFAKDNPDSINSILKTYNMNISGLTIFMQELLIDEKFNKIKILLEDTNEI